MCYISTLIDLNLGILFVESPRCKEKLQIELESDSYISGRVEMEIHNLRYKVQVYGDEVDDWFSNAVGRPCSLLRSFGLSGSKRYPCSNRNQSVGMCIEAKSRLNFVNEAQLLLISEQSVSDLNTRLSSKNVEKGSSAAPIQVNPMRFRPNLVIAGGEPYVEDGWQRIRIGNQYFTSLGGCNRCQMININYQAGEVQRLNEPLATLAAYRRVKGKIFFGILLRYDDDNKEEAGSMIQVGEEVYSIEDLL